MNSEVGKMLGGGGEREGKGRTGRREGIRKGKEMQRGAKYVHFFFQIYLSSFFSPPSLPMVTYMSICYVEYFPTSCSSILYPPYPLVIILLKQKSKNRQKEGK